MAKSLSYISAFSLTAFPQAYCLDPVINFDPNTQTGNIRVVVYADKAGFAAGKEPLATKDYAITADNYAQYLAAGGTDFSSLIDPAWIFVKMMDNAFSASTTVK